MDSGWHLSHRTQINRWIRIVCALEQGLRHTRFFYGSAETCSWFLFFHCCSLPSALPAPTTNVLFSCLFSCNDLSYPGPRISSSPFCFHISSEFQMCFNVSLLPRKVNAASNVIGFILQRIPEKSFKRKVLSWEETHECRTAPHL